MPFVGCCALVYFWTLRFSRIGDFYTLRLGFFGNLDLRIIELAQANHIKVVLCSVLPANRYGWSPEVQPADTIIALNELIKDYARSKRLIYVDFYTALVDEQKGLNPNYGRDSVHPNLDGYKVMEPLVVKGIKRALSRP